MNMARALILVGSTAVLWSSHALAKDDVSICMSIMSQEVISKDTSFRLSDNSSVSKTDICNELSRSKSTGGGFSYGFIGLDASQSEAKAEKLCSSSFNSNNSKEINELFKQEVGDNQLSAFKECLNTVGRANDFEISNYKMNANEALPGAGGTGKNVPFYSFSITFKWIPPTSKLTDSVLFIPKVHADQIIDCKLTPGNFHIKPFPGWTEQFDIKPLTNYIYTCDAVRGIISPVITLAIQDGTSITLEFPKLI